MAVGARPFKTRTGAWVRPGRSGSNPLAPGSWKDYVLVRSGPKPYAKTAQQKKIGEAGRRVGKECKGQSGSAFYECRHKALGFG